MKGESNWTNTDLNPDPRSSIEFETSILPQFLIHKTGPKTICVRLFTTEFDPGSGLGGAQGIGLAGGPVDSVTDCVRDLR